jgi:hypothetical protein
MINSSQTHANGLRQAALASAADAGVICDTRSHKYMLLNTLLCSRNLEFCLQYPTSHATRKWYEASGTMYPVKRNREGNRNCECHAVGGQDGVIGQM